MGSRSNMRCEDCSCPASWRRQALFTTSTRGRVRLYSCRTSASPSSSPLSPETPPTSSSTTSARPPTSATTSAAEPQSHASPTWKESHGVSPPSVALVAALTMERPMSTPTTRPCAPTASAAMRVVVPEWHPNSTTRSPGFSTRSAARRYSSTPSVHITTGEPRSSMASSRAASAPLSFSSTLAEWNSVSCSCVSARLLITARILRPGDISTDVRLRIAATVSMSRSLPVMEGISRKRQLTGPRGPGTATTSAATREASHSVSTRCSATLDDAASTLPSRSRLRAELRRPPTTPTVVTRPLYPTARSSTSVMRPSSCATSKTCSRGRSRSTVPE
mmetsp:Transcript_34801/g.89047  ORF Transcript_34801/g.89047 Transcript_34801/m.89047 type:complete len:334 (+) Transcript_34801:449-1450(+)